MEVDEVGTVKVMNAFGDDPVREDDHAEPPAAPEDEQSWDADALADEMSEESFPTSDPPSTWTGVDRRQAVQSD